MKSFDWNAFDERPIAVWCETEEEAIDFCNQSHEHGYDWCSGAGRDKLTYWGRNKEETCYIAHEFADRGFYEEMGYVIVKWSYYMVATKPIFTKSDLKDGDVVFKRNGYVEIAIPSVGAFVCKAGYNSLDNFREDLTSTLKEKYDIMEVRRPNKPSDCTFLCFELEKGEVVYNRERDTVPIVEMTLEQICEALGKKIKIVEE